MFYNLPKDEYRDKKIENKLKITLKDSTEIIIKEPASILFVDQNKILIMENDSVKSEIYFDTIDKIQEEKFSFGKTFFRSFWVSLGVGSIIFMLFVLIYGPLKF